MVSASSTNGSEGGFKRETSLGLHTACDFSLRALSWPARWVSDVDREAQPGEHTETGRGLQGALSDRGICSW